MANRYWVGGTNTWNATLTGKWATSSGGAPGAAVPTAADDVFFDNLSTGTVTLATGIVCRSINCTGFTGTITHPTATVLNIGDATAGAGNIAIKLVASMTWSSGGNTSVLNFISTSTTQQTVDYAGKTINGNTYNGAGSSWLLTSSMVMGPGATLTLTAGTLDINNLNHTWGLLSSSNSNTRTLTLGSSTITMLGATFDCTISTNMTLNAGTSTIGWTSSTSVTPTIAIPNLALYNVLVTKSSGGMTLNGTGTATFHNLTMDNTVVGGGNRAININTSGGIAITGIFKHYGATATNAGLIFSGTTGSARTIALGTTGSVDFNNVDFRDITVTGTAAPVSGTRFGDGGGNSGITFPASKTMYAIANIGSWNSTTNWSLTSGGASAGEIPLIHDTAVFDVNTFSTTARVVSMNNQRSCGFDASTATNQPTFRFTNPSGAANAHYGSMIFPTAGSTIDAVGAAGGATTIQTYGRSNYSLTTNGAVLDTAITLNINGPGGVYTLGSDLVMNDTTRQFQHNFGTFNANGFNVTCGVFTSSNTAVRAINMGSGTWTLNGTGTVWNFGTDTNCTFNAGTSTLVVSDTSATTKTLSMGSVTATLYNLSITGGGTGSVTLGGSTTRTFNNLTIGAPKNIILTSGATRQVNGIFTAVGSVGNIISITSSTPGSQATLSKASGVVSSDYLSLQDTAATGGATWYAGANSTNVSNNTGWIFTAPPVTGGNIKVHNGTTFVAKPVKVWNGSVFVIKPLKVWNGTTWVKTTY